jgi:hypothetical protein
MKVLIHIKSGTGKEIAAKTSYFNSNSQEKIDLEKIRSN